MTRTVTPNLPERKINYSWMGPELELAFARNEAASNRDLNLSRIADAFENGIPFNNRKAKADEPEAPAVAYSLDELEAVTKATDGLAELVTGFFPARSVNLLAGDSGLGKSPLVCQLAVCVAAGKPFLNQSVKQGTVIIADFENDAALAPMLRSVAKAVGATAADFMPRLHILQRPSQKALIAAAKELKAALVVVDSLRGFDSTAETKAESAAAIIAKLQEQDGCWILMHHLRKQAAEIARPSLIKDDLPVLTWLENVAGARALVNQTFTRIAVDGSDKDAADIVLRGFYKGRGEFGPIHLERVFDDEQPIGYSRIGGEQLLNLNQQTDLRKVRAMDRPVTFSELVELLGSKSKVSRFLGACRNLGLVESDGDKMAANRRYQFQDGKH
jgi:hypothetical protein